MARTMIAANQAIFSKLASVAGSLVAPAVAAQRRAVATTSLEKQWLKQTEFLSSTHLELGPNARLVFARFDGGTYLISIGVGISTLPEHIESIEINAGLFTAIAADLDLPLVHAANLGAELCEYIFYDTGDARPAELIDQAILRKYYTSVYAFRIDGASSLLCDDFASFRIAIAFILGANSSVPLAWSNAARALIMSMVHDVAERAPFHLIFRAITESRKDAAFLSIYRCIEQLFPLPRVNELVADLQIARPPMEVARSLERLLNWRHREEDALALLFEHLDQALIGRIASAAQMPAQDWSPRSVAKKVYELRNGSVHFRPIHAAASQNIQHAWMDLSEALLEAVDILYRTHAGAFP